MLRTTHSEGQSLVLAVPSSPSAALPSTPAARRLLLSFSTSVMRLQLLRPCLFPWVDVPSVLCLPAFVLLPCVECAFPSQPHGSFYLPTFTSFFRSSPSLGGPLWPPETPVLRPQPQRSRSPALLSCLCSVCDRCLNVWPVHGCVLPLLWPFQPETRSFIWGMFSCTVLLMICSLRYFLSSLSSPALQMDSEDQSSHYFLSSVLFLSSSVCLLSTRFLQLCPPVLQLSFSFSLSLISQNSFCCSSLNITS